MKKKLIGCCVCLSTLVVLGCSSSTPGGNAGTQSQEKTQEIIQKAKDDQGKSPGGVMPNMTPAGQLQSPDSGAPIQGQKKMPAGQGLPQAPNQ